MEPVIHVPGLKLLFGVIVLILSNHPKIHCAKNFDRSIEIQNATNKSTTTIFEDDLDGLNLEAEYNEINDIPIPKPNEYPVDPNPTNDRPENGDTNVQPTTASEPNSSESLKQIVPIFTVMVMVSIHIWNPARI